MDKLDFKKIGRSCPICFNDQCPSRESCLRFLAARQVPEDVEAHLCVLPWALRGEKCSMYQQAETIRVAYGFERSFDSVLGKDLPRLRKALMGYFGYRVNYYNHLRGKWPLLPKQCEEIEAIFRRFGCETVQFDRMEDEIVINPIPY